jgi:hypothetical protein
MGNSCDTAVVHRVRKGTRYLLSVKIIEFYEKHGRIEHKKKSKMIVNALFEALLHLASGTEGEPRR